MNSLLNHRILTPSSALLAGASLLVLMPLFSTGDTQVPHTFQSGTKALASEVNANFDALMGAVDDLRPANRIVVATDGGDFDSVADALASITDASATNPYLVWVAPGVYTESQTSTVPSFVSLVGADAASTVVTSSLSQNFATSAAATVTLEDLGSLKGLTIENTASSQTAVGVFGANLSRETSVSDCVVRAIGTGGVGHFAVKFDDSDVSVIDCLLQAEGAGTVNAAFASIDGGGAFAQPRIVSSVLEAKVVSGGFGLQLSSTAATVEDCEVEGWDRAITTSVNGITTVRGSVMRTLGLSAVYEQTGSATILSGTTQFIGGNPVGLASQFKYVWCIKANLDAVVNGFGSTVQ